MRNKLKYISCIFAQVQQSDFKV